MNFGKDCGIRIINERQKNIFGTIIDYRDGNKLTIKISEPIKGNNIYVTTLLLKPIDPLDTFKSLLQYYSLHAKIYLFDSETGNSEYLMDGIVSID